MNNNAYAGMKIEKLIKNSIKDYPSVIDKLKERFGIQGILENTSLGGIYGGKSDVRISFACGHHIDANVKGFKDDIGFNQLTRTTVSKFSELFNINNEGKNELESIMINKARNTNGFLFPPEPREKWRMFFDTNIKRIVKWGFSENSSREILVLYNRTTSIVKIYAMKDILKNIFTEVKFTKGSINIGNCISFQRKGGNGSLSKGIPKHEIQHPGNNIQLKLRTKRFIAEFKSTELAEYKI